MAIIMRNGLEADFDPNKMRAGELAIVTDARELHATFAPGDSPKVLLDGEAVPNPETVGTEGQVLALDENGDPEWKSVAAPSDAQVEAAVTDWLDEHPEATTTVEDGAITYAKLDSNLKGTVDEVGELKSEIDDANSAANSGIMKLHLVPNTYITGTGVEAYYNGWSSTDFVNVIPGGSLHVTAQNRLTYNAFYDENKTFITGGTFTIDIGYNNITVPNNAYYCRISGKSEHMENVVVYTDVKVKVSALEGSTSFYYDIINTKVKAEKINAYSNCALTVGRVFKGVYDSSVTSIKCTDYIEIIPKHTYAVYGGYLTDDYRYYFDTSKNIKGVLPYTELLTTYPYTNSSLHMIFTAPDDAGFVRFNFRTADISGDVVPAGFYFVDITHDPLASVKVLVIGDSISADYYGGYPKWVTNLTSEGYFLHPNVKNDSIHATGFVARYSATDDDTFLARLETYNQANYDWVILFGGINDFVQSINFDTFESAVDDYFAYLTSHFYNKKLCVFSPLMTAVTTANSAGHTQLEYADYIKTVAKSYGISVLNLTEESGYFPFVDEFKNQWTLLPEGQSAHDGVHPTEAWEKQFLVPIVKNYFRRFYE